MLLRDVLVTCAESCLIKLLVGCWQTINKEEGSVQLVDLYKSYFLIKVC